MPWQNVQESLQNLANSFIAQQQKKKEIDEALKMMIMQAQIKQQFDPEAQFRQQMLQMFQDGGMPQGQGIMPQSQQQNGMPQIQQPMGGGFRPESFTYGGFTMKRQPNEAETQADINKKLAEQRALSAEKGLSIETGGKLAMVAQAKKDIQEVRDMLFPDGTAKSFKRGLAFASNIPGSRAPLVGALIPQALPFHELGQKIYSRLQNAVAAKLRVETGAQANPSEVENILRRFGITSFSDPKAAFDALKRLEDFMDTTISITNPSGNFGISVNKQNGNSNLNNLKSKYGLK